MFKVSLVIIVVSLLQLAKSKNVGDLEQIMSILAEKVNSFQVLKPLNSSLPFHWYEKKGLFRSDIRLNFAGNPVFQALRNGEASVFDNDMFSSGWIVTALLEANLYGKGAPVFEKERLDLALSAISEYNNKNDFNNKQSVVRTFWQQHLNTTSGLWFQEPTNIRTVVLLLKQSFDLIPWKQIESFLKTFGLTRLEKFVESIQKNGGDTPKLFLDAFCIPPDFDDTYLNLGLGATLSKLSSQYPDIYTSWLRNNSNIDHLVDVTVKYAYEPFSSDLNKNLIDPRTYFYARGFINEAFKTNSSLSLITTWIQNVEEQHDLKKDSISMPFNLNNIDVTVGANFVYGATAASIYNTNNYGNYLLKSSDLQRVYLNTTKFIAWSIKSNFTSRPDLAQVYYPSRYNFLWYSSRTLFLIENEFRQMEISTDKKFVQHFDSIKDILAEAKFYLQDAFENTVTDYLINSAQTTGYVTFFCDFLGQNDTDVFGRPEKNNEDCLFTTAQAINILIATWTYQNPQTKRLTWKVSTPDDAKHLLLSSVQWLQTNIFRNEYKKFNAFFSGSVKGFSDLPFWYPANYLELLNGTSVDTNIQTQEYLESAIIGVKGLIDEDTYQKMLTQKHFNVSTPLDFKGYNAEIGFPFWSSEPYTYAVSLLALAQFNNLDI